MTIEIATLSLRWLMTPPVGGGRSHRGWGTGGWRLRHVAGPPEYDAIPGEDLRAEHTEQQDALHRPGQARGEPGPLQREPGVNEHADEERRHHDRDRVVAAKRRHHDAGVAEPGLLQTPRIESVAEVADLARPADPGHGAGKRHE